MGYVSVPRIIDIDPKHISPFPPGTALPPLGDHLAKVARTAHGILISSDGYSIAASINTEDAWHLLKVIVGDGITDLEVERLNKYLKGTGWPRYETNWRTEKVSINLPGKRIPVPVSASGVLVSSKLDQSSFRWVSLKGGTGVGATLPIAAPVASPPPVVAPSAPIAAAISALEEHDAKSALRGAPTASPKVVSPAGAALSPEGTEVMTAPPSLRDWRKRVVSPTKPEPEVRPLKAERIAPVGDPTGVFTWPTKSADIIIPDEIQNDLDLIWGMHRDGDRQVIILAGPAGTGKTSLAFDLAARHKVPVAKIDAAGAVTFADWVGFVGATEQNGATVTEYRPSGFIQAIRADNPVMAGKPRIVLIDEINRAESSGSLNALIPVFDHTGSLYVADAGRSIPLDPAVMFVATCNMGAAFTGTVALDAALNDRMTHWIEMGYPSQPDEVRIITGRTGLDEPRAAMLIAAATQIRGIADRGEITSGVGPRKVLMAARKVVKGFSMRSACHSTWTLAYSGEGGTSSERGIVRSAIDSIIPVK